MLGETPLELHRRLRMERAAWTLQQGDAPVTAVAFAAGYETHESFTRAFRGHYGCSPSEFRQGGNPDEPGAARPFQIQLAVRSGIHFEPTGSSASRIRFDQQGEETMKTEIKDVKEMRVAMVPHVGPYNRISEAFARLGQLAGGAGLIREGAIMLALYSDDPETTPPSELRSDAALSVPPDAVLPPGLVEGRLPGGRYACAVHVGPYEHLGDAWARLMGEWLPRSGHRVKDGPSFERYLNTPGNAPMEKLETELYVPLE